MLGPVLLSLSLAVAPAAGVDPVAVIVTSERMGAAEAADAVATQVHQALVREGWAQTLDVTASSERVKATGFADPRKCKGARSCVSKLAVLLGARAVVVSVDVGKLGGTLAIHLEAVAADDERSLEVTDVTAGTDLLAEKSALPVTLFARAVAAKLKARAAVAHAPRPGDAPTVTTLTPGPSGLPADGELAGASAGPALAALIAVTALTGAAAIATVALVVVASGARSQ
ncbi:MAG: hypothetical protein K1X89_29760, partial [Myxococcaceae bacterium]|nr:hypothetical protein [Myxococcaceae bacterium]